MYELHRLGWHSFQQLCLTITREILGQTVESFLDSNDGGRDGAFAGAWNPTGQEDISGHFVIQCKFTSRAQHTLRVSELKDEKAKAARLAKERRCDCYVLLTNAGVSGSQAAKISTLFKSVGVKHVVILGSTWISQQIRESKRLRMLVPRVYGLGDLSQILDQRAYAQAHALLATLRDDLSKIVVTGAYSRSAAALDQHGFVLLIGEPAAGKTTIASLLAMGALDQWNASTLKLDDPGKVIEHWNPDEPAQFFWLDDAFGVTQYESALVHGWNHILPQIRTMIRRGARIVMTSRDYIYKRARNDLKESAFPLLKESQVVIDVHDLMPNEKRQILYNHLKLGRQPQEFRTQIKSHLEAIATHERFVPETARRLGEPLFTKALWIDRHYLLEFVDKREQFLNEVLRGLDVHSRAALALIYMRNDRLESPIDLQQSERDALDRLGSDLGNCVTALDALDGSLVQRVASEGDFIWRFKHPTIGDAYASLLAESAELLGIYVRGTSTEDLLAQVTCGDVRIERAVVIPRPLFPLMLQRLQEFASTKSFKTAWMSAWGAKRSLHNFLASRCSKEFLALYIEQNPAVLEAVSRPGLMLSAVSEVDLAIRLHALDLLPEEGRQRFVSTVSDYAIEGDDAYALQSERVRSLFSDAECNVLEMRVRNELIPRLAHVRREWENNHRSDDSPEEYMQPLLDAFETLKNLFDGDEAITKRVERETGLAQQWIGENMPDEPDDNPKPELGATPAADPIAGDRSIFDDVND